MTSARFTFHASHLTPFVLFILVFLTVLALYLLTLAPGVVGGDAGEHQFAAPLLGIPHTTGYPLYILLGKLWTLLIPVGTMAWRMNLFSAINGALAAAITSLIVYYSYPEKVFPPVLGRDLGTRSGRFFPLFFIPKSPNPGENLSEGLSLSPPLASRIPGALIAGLTLACGLTLWQWSTIAGVRSMTILFFALLTLEAIIWQQRMEAWNGKHGTGSVEDEKSRDMSPTLQPSNPPTPYWLALTIGLSLAHHRTTVFFLPSLAGWVVWHNPRLLRQPRRLLPLILLALAPLSLYAFTYFRGVHNPPYSHEKITDLQSFWFLVGSGDSSGLFLSIDPAFLPARLAFIWNDLLLQLSWPGVILAILGGLWLLWRRPVHFVFQALLMLLLLLFTLDFEVVNLNEAPAWYLMPAYFLLAAWVGLGVNEIWDGGYEIWARRQNRESFTIHYSLLIQTCFTIAIIVLLAYSLAWPNWQSLYLASTTPLDDWRQLLRGRQAERLVEASLPLVEPNSIIWGDWEQYTPFKYYQLIDGWRPDVTVRNPLDRWPEKVAAAHAADQPIYFTRKPTDLIGTPYLTMVGPLIYLQTAPRLTPPDGIIPLNASFEDELELLGYQAEIMPQNTPEGAEADSILQLTLYWRVPKKVQWDYALSLRLLDPVGQEIYKKDATHPVLSSYPTTLWTPGEVVGDFYELPLSPGNGPPSLYILPYRTEGAGQWHNLILEGSEPPQEGIKIEIRNKK